MKILYLLHFNAPMGGLHENVYSSALFMKQQNHDVYVVLKEGPLRDRLIENDIHTIKSDYTNIVQTLKDIESSGIHFDIIHAHPGPSRNTALHYSVKHSIPAIMTYHGMWLDSLNQYIDKLSAVICVSEGIKYFAQQKLSHGHEKLFVMPNGYNDDLYETAQLFNNNDKIDTLNISFVSRLDEDKKFILDVFKIGLKHLSTNEKFHFNINIIGEGTLRNHFITECQEMLKNSNHNLKFVGWQVDHNLKQFYLDSDIVIAPGRSAIEAMACGKPVISIGSKNYIGLIKHDNWMTGIYNNFGGFGKKFEDYDLGSIESDLNILLNDTKNINLIGRFSHDIATSYYKEDTINMRLLSLYQSIILENSIKKSINNI